MDAKSKAEFINSVANGSSIPCPKCGTENKSDSAFCISCGAELTSVKEVQTSTPAFQAHDDENITTTPSFKYVEPNNVFAEGLPSWSIEPPQVMVRRH